MDLWLLLGQLCCLGEGKYLQLLVLTLILKGKGQKGTSWCNLFSGLGM